MQIEPIADFRSPLTDKFGIPRQSGLTPSLEGRIVFREAYRNPEALRGLSGADGFDRIWLIWGFSAVPEDRPWQPTVRPPRLGGNVRMGVWATRSPFRPNPLGLSCVRILSVAEDGSEIRVAGADLMDGTPVYDIKPYVVYADCFPDAAVGFAAGAPLPRLRVEWAEGLRNPFSPEKTAALTEILALDPRPAYQNEPGKRYGMAFDGYDVAFSIDDEGLLTILNIKQL